MKAAVSLRLRVLLASVTAVPILWSYADGPDPFKTGGPFPNESICAEAGCHAAPNRINTGQGSITFTVSPYRPGEKQTITVTVSDPAATQRRFGFQLTARLANSLRTSAGTFRAVDNNVEVICGDPANPAGGLAVPCGEGRVEFAQHKFAVNRTGTASVSFSVEWTAPTSNVGDITFAAAGNASNGNMLSDPGDNIYQTDLRVSPASDSPTPEITSGGVVGAGLSTPRVTQISANGIVSVFGQNFAPAGTALLAGAGADGKLPTNLGGVCVQVGNALGRMFFLSPGQINVQAPTIPDRGNIAVQVIANCGQSESKSDAATVSIQAVAPEFFFFKFNPDGKNPVAATDARTGALVGAAGLLPGATFTPAKPGDFLALYATGLGATDPAFEAGVLPDTIARTTEKVTVSLNNVTLPDSDVLYAGVAPGFAGLYQVNIRVPDSAPDGDLPVGLNIGGVSAPAGAFVTVKR